MGFFDSTSTSNPSSGTSGAQTEEGDPTSITIAGTGKKSNVSVNVTNHVLTTDHGAIEGSFEVVEDSLEFAGGAFNRSLETVELALDKIEGASQDIKYFAAGSLELNERVLQAGLDAAGKALDFGEDIFSDALAATQTALFESRAAREDALEFGAGVLQQQGQFAAASLKAVQTSSSRAFDAIEDTTEQFGEFAAGTIQYIRESQIDGSVALSEQANKGLALISERTKSETTQSFDKLVKFAGISFAAVAALLLLTRTKAFA